MNPHKPSAAVSTFGDHEVITSENKLRDRISNRPLAPGEEDPIARAERALIELSTEFGGWMHSECERLDQARRALADGGFTKANKEALFHAAHGDQVDEIIFQQQRRARQYRDCDLRLVGGERVHHHPRRLLRAREHFGERAPHQRRRIVEQHDHRAFGGGEIVGGKIGVQIGARQRGRGFGPVAGRRIADPLQELTDNHATTRRDDSRLYRRRKKLSRGGLTKRSP